MSQQTTDLAACLRSELARKKISNLCVANAIGRSAPTVSRKLGGHAAITLDELHVIADLIGVPVASLLPPAKASA